MPRETPMPNSMLAALLIYHLILGGFAIYMILSIWPGTVPPPQNRVVGLFGGRVTLNLNVEVTLLLVVVFAALVGAFVHSFASIAWHRAHDALEERWATWYITRPFIGVGLALLIYFLLRAGFLNFSTEASSINLYGVAAISGIAGMFTQKATEKLRDLADALLMTTES